MIAYCGRTVGAQGLVRPTYSFQVRSYSCDRFLDIAAAMQFLQLVPLQMPCASHSADLPREVPQPQFSQ